jgi:uncharacterized protein YcbK (DUF882 family)
MGNLSKNISRYEVACRCGCCSDSIDTETIKVLQACCDHFSEEAGYRVVVIISSGNRCLEYNRIPVSDGGPGSNDGSYHPKGRALDFRIANVAPAKVYKHLDEKYPGKYGIGKYPKFTHLDTRTNGGARW